MVNFAGGAITPPESNFWMHGKVERKNGCVVIIIIIIIVNLIFNNIILIIT